MELNKIDKYISKFADKIEYSQTTNSRYYNVCGHRLRISDHAGFSPQYDWSIVFDQRNPDNYILMGSVNTALTVMNYEETKSFIKSWVLMSQTNPAKLKNDDYDIFAKINSKLGDIQSYITAKPKSANDLVDISKLTIKQLKEVQGIILENELVKNNLAMTVGRASQTIAMDEFTPAQRSTIQSFLMQNKKKHFK